MINEVGRHRVRIYHDDSLSSGLGGEYTDLGGQTPISLALTLDQPVADDLDTVEVRIGRSMAQARMIARRFFDEDGHPDRGFMANGDLRTIAQLWHSFHVAHGGEIPVSFLRLGDKGEADDPVIEGFVANADLEAPPVGYGRRQGRPSQR